MEFIKADKNKFALFHTIYTAANIFCRFDWNERIDDAVYCFTDKTPIFVCDGDRIAGGFTLKDNCINYPFIATPFDNRIRFWGAVLEYAVKTSGHNEIFLNEIPEVDAEVLMRSFGTTLKSSKRKMIRPTEQCAPVLCDDFYFDTLDETDITEIIAVVYEAHASGHTSTVWKPDMAEIEAAIKRRFESFGQTKTLYMSNTVKRKANNEIVGVCIAGVYPEPENYSTSSFATIHQVSVKPAFQRMGIAKAMILKAINEACVVSPVITLGVLIGNPAEELYKNMGFKPGPNYSELGFYPIFDDIEKSAPSLMNPGLRGFS